MSNQKKVVLIGWHPSVVDYSKYPGLTPEKLEAALASDCDGLNQLGYDAQQCPIHSSETAQADVESFLAKNKVDCVLIGAGVRGDPEHFLVFEALVNAAHRAAPQAVICFNTKPTDTAAAVQRWL